MTTLTHTDMRLPQSITDEAAFNRPTALSLLPFQLLEVADQAAVAGYAGLSKLQGGLVLPLAEVTLSLLDWKSPCLSDRSR